MHFLTGKGAKAKGAHLKGPGRVMFFVVWQGRFVSSSWCVTALLSSAWANTTDSTTHVAISIRRLGISTTAIR
eukprot:COSAG06_NODE_1973_length_7938_cov_3.557852_7_plen_73_part_00